MRLMRWRRAWLVVLVLLVALPMAAFLPPVQRLFFPLRYEQELVSAARRAGVDPYLVAAVAYRESGFRPDAVSEVGAIGLMQLLPSTGSWAAEESGLPTGDAPPDLQDPHTNLRLGSWYLAWLLERFEGDPVLALAAYNGGQHTVDTWRRSEGDGRLALEDLPYPETRAFVENVLEARQRYERLYPELASLD